MENFAQAEWDPLGEFEIRKNENLTFVGYIRALETDTYKPLPAKLPPSYR